MRGWIVVAVLAAGCERKLEPFGGSASSDDRTAEPARDANPARLVVDTEVAAPNTPTTARVRVVPREPFHINDKYRFKLALEPSPGVQLTKTTFAPADAEKFDSDELVVAVPVVATTSGDFTIRGNVDVGVCSPRSCLTEHLPVTIAIAAR